jgi:hypothetical protein
LKDEKNNLTFWFNPFPTRQVFYLPHAYITGPERVAGRREQGNTHHRQTCNIPVANHKEKGRLSTCAHVKSFDAMGENKR